MNLRIYQIRNSDNEIKHFANLTDWHQIAIAHYDQHSILLCMHWERDGITPKSNSLHYISVASRDGMKIVAVLPINHLVLSRQYSLAQLEEKNYTAFTLRTLIEQNHIRLVLNDSTIAIKLLDSAIGAYLQRLQDQLYTQNSTINVLHNKLDQCMNMVGAQNNILNRLQNNLAGYEHKLTLQTNKITRAYHILKNNLETTNWQEICDQPQLFTYNYSWIRQVKSDLHSEMLSRKVQN